MMSLTSKTGTGLIYESLSGEQHEIERLLDQLESYESVPMDSWREEQLAQLLQDLEMLTNTHFTCEEYGLFPILKKYHPMVLMEKEHDLMISLREEVRDAFHHFRDYPLTAPSFKEKVKHFVSEMRRHFKQEQQGIYRIAERDLSPQEKEQVVNTMMELRTKAGSGLIYTIQRAEKHFYPFKSDLSQTFSKPVASHKLLERPDVIIKQISIRAGEPQTEQWAPTRSIAICQRGTVKCYMKGQELTLDPGAGILIEAGLVPSYEAVTNCDLLFIIEQEQSHH